jgi:hypothetical protein
MGVSHKKHLPFLVTDERFFSKSQALMPPPLNMHPFSIILRGRLRSKKHLGI